MAPHPSISQWRIDFSLTDPVSTAAMVTKLLVGMQLLRLGMALAISLSGIVGVHLGVMTVTSSSKTRHVRCFDILLGSTLLQFLAQMTGLEQPRQPLPAHYQDSVFAKLVARVVSSQWVAFVCSRRVPQAAVPNSLCSPRQTHDNSDLVM